MGCFIFCFFRVYLFVCLHIGGLVLSSFFCVVPTLVLFMMLLLLASFSCGPLHWF
jgi:hypothetical protein